MTNDQQESIAASHQPSGGAKGTFSFSLSLAALTSPPVDATNRTFVLKMGKHDRPRDDGTLRRVTGASSSFNTH